jgi:hypothetical protein
MALAAAISMSGCVGWVGADMLIALGVLAYYAGKH